MKRSRQQPFIMFSGGPIPILVPRGLKGSAQFAVWLALLVPLILCLDEFLDSDRAAPDSEFGVLLVCLGIVAWLIGGLWWMTAHSQVILWVEMQRDRQYKRRERDRNRPR